MDNSLVAVTLITALGCGLNAGVFFAFSSFVVKALARLQPAQGIAAMQSAVSVLAVWALVDWHGSFGPYLLAGSGLYLLGTIGLTIAYHVPATTGLRLSRRRAPRQLTLGSDT